MQFFVIRMVVDKIGTCSYSIIEVFDFVEIGMRRNSILTPLTTDLMVE